MTARFALYLNPDAIMLAERQGEGWKFRGQADPADPGFAGQLALLRTAAAGDGAEAETLLVLPDDQIRVEQLTPDGGAADPADEVPGLLAEILGLSPQDLGLDWQRSDGTIVAALVARQTLTEAEGFARAHGFTPAGAVARSDLAGFTGSPWFGTADGLAERPADLPAIGPVEREMPAAAGIFTSSIAAERRMESEAPPEPSIEEPADAVPGKQLESPAFSARDRARIAASLVPYDLDPEEFPEERENTRRPAARPRAAPGPARRNVARFGLVLTFLLIAAMAGAAFWFGGRGSDDHVILLPDAAPTPQAPLANPPIAALPSTGPAPGEDETADAAPTVTLPPLADAFGPAPDAAMPVTNGTLPDFAEARDAFVPSPALVDRADRTPVDVVEQPGIDPETGTDALALAPEARSEAETAPAALPSPPPPGRQFELGEDGLVKATKEGVTTPDGVLVFAGHPPVTPQQRALPDPQVFAAPIEGAADDPLRKLRPRTRPEGLVDNHQRAQLGGHTLDELARLRPDSRPDAVEEAAAKLNTASDLAVASVARPGARPEDLAIRVPDLSSAATAAVAAALAPQPQAPAPAAPAPQPAAVQPAAPRAPAPQPVAPQTTTRTAATAAPSTAPARGSEFSMSKVSLLGTFGHSSKPRALVRMPNGRVMNLEVGDRIDGGRVAAIRAGELYYSKGGKNHVLLMPKG